MDCTELNLKESIVNSGVITRTHDQFYQNVDPNLPPKDSFVFIGKLINSYKKTRNENLKIIDIGCATGAFPNYLNSIFPRDHIEGLEFLYLLVEASKKMYPNLNIKQGSVLNKNTIDRHSFDVITLNGVLSIFDDIEPIISNLIYWTKPKGKIFIHGMFNPHAIDVFIKYRHSDKYNENSFESGWNIISQETVKNLFIKYGAKKFIFHSFEMSADLEPNKSDPVRSWTEKSHTNSKYITNGLCIKQPQFILEVDL